MEAETRALNHITSPDSRSRRCPPSDDLFSRGPHRMGNERDVLIALFVPGLSKYNKEEYLFTDLHSCLEKFQMYDLSFVSINMIQMTFSLSSNKFFDPVYFTVPNLLN